MRHAAVISAALLALALAGHANAGTVYSNAFDTGSTANFTGSGGYTPTIVTAPNGSTKFLGDLSTGQTTAVLTLNTAGLSSLTLNYDLYAILSQDGDANGAGGGNGDSFVVTAGGKTITDYTFANYREIRRNIPAQPAPLRRAQSPKTLLDMALPEMATTTRPTLSATPSLRLERPL